MLLPSLFIFLLPLISSITSKPNPKSKCENGWKFFQRPKGGWCMKVFPGTMTQLQSQAQCVSQKATLSGLQNTAEINWVVSSTLKVIVPQTSGGVWIGIERRPECYGSRMSAVCNRATTFFWTDNSTTGLDGMKFQGNNPDNGDGFQHCALLFAATKPSVNAAGISYSGQLDDIRCDSSATLWWTPGSFPRQNKAFLCGKKSK